MSESMPRLCSLGLSVSSSPPQHLNQVKQLKATNNFSLIAHILIFFSTAPSVAPFNVSLSILNPSTVELTWMPPSIEDRNGIIRYYWIHIHEKNMSDAPFQLIREIRVNSSPASIADLHPSYQYQLSISAVTVHSGPFDNLTSWTMPEDGMTINVHTCSENSLRYELVLHQNYCKHSHYTWHTRLTHYSHCRVPLIFH